MGAEDEKGRNVFNAFNPHALQVEKYLKADCTSHLAKPIRRGNLAETIRAFFKETKV